MLLLCLLPDKNFHPTANRANTNDIKLLSLEKMLTVLRMGNKI